jgi:hypothetical protein
MRTAAVGTGFDEALRYGEDVDLVWRLRERGWRVRYVPEVSVHHQEPRNWGRLLRRRFLYGTSAAPLSRRHPGRLGPVVLAPEAAVALTMLWVRQPLWCAAAIALSGLRPGLQMHSVGAPAVLGPWSRAQSTARSALAVGRSSTVLAPVSLAAALRWRRARVPVAVLVLGPVLWEWSRRSIELGPVTFTAAAVVDDLAYGLGVWAGCAQARTIAPLVPKIRARRP